MLNQEIEEGELNSTDDEQVDCQKSKTNKNRDNLNDTEDLSDQNPYDEEDEMIIKLKMKALESLLVKSPTNKKDLDETLNFENATNENTDSNLKVKMKKLKKNTFLKKNSYLKKFSSKKRKKFEANSYLNENNQTYFNNLGKKNLAKLNELTVSTSTTPACSSYHQDSYEIQDMEIDAQPQPPQLTHPHQTYIDQFRMQSDYLISNFFSPGGYMQANFATTQSYFNTWPQQHSVLTSPPAQNSLFSPIARPKRLNKKFQPKAKKQQKRFNNPNLKQIKSMPKPEVKPVQFTLSSSDSSLVSPVESQPTVSTFNTNGLDVDERFLDKTTCSLDVDYRQLNPVNLTTLGTNTQEQLIQSILGSINEKIEMYQKSQEKAKTPPPPAPLPAPTPIQSLPLAPVPVIDVEEEQKEDEEDEQTMLELKKQLLDTLNQKRIQKKQQQEEELKQQEQKNQEDISIFKKKLIEHEQALMATTTEANKTEQVKKQTSFVGKAKLLPIIIRVNPNGETSDSEDEEDKKSLLNKSLEENIGLFLKEAKQMAVNSPLSKENESKNNKKLSPEQIQVKKPNTSLPPPVPTPLSVMNESDLKKLQEKKSVIKSLRDRINLKSKMILEMSKKSSLLLTFETKKAKDVEITKQKIAMLKEQLQAAEKILHVNELALDKIKKERRGIDLKLSKVQHMKKNQQEMLQKVLSAPNLPALVDSVNPKPIETPVKLAKVISTPVNLGKTEKAKPMTAPPPPPPPPPPPSPSLPLAPPKLSMATTIIRKLPTRMTLGGVVSAAVVSKPEKQKTQNVNSVYTITRPNLNASKLTNSKLEQLASKQTTATLVKPTTSTSQTLNENIVVNAKVVSASKENSNLIKSVCQKDELKNRQRLNECLDDLSKDYPYIHAESFDIWSNESILDQKDAKKFGLIINNDILDSCSDISATKPTSISVNKVLTSSNFCNLQECEASTIKQDSNEIYIIEDVANYQSPLKAFRGYRFSSHFAKFNQFEDAYSKFYCNAIDFRRPFCPFDLHGSCKDSNCIYQHSNIMTMDNFQRTEHFLSYCPQLLELSGEHPTQREVIKKLKNYAKTFMNNNLNKMSIKDYFKYLYDHVVENLKLDPPYSTILSRIPILCLNNNKSIGVFDHLELENETDSETKDILTNSQLVKLNSNLSDCFFVDSGDHLNSLLDIVLSVNMKRSLDSRLKKYLINSELDLEWLKNSRDLLQNEDDQILAWIFYAKYVYLNSNGSNQVEKILNVFSHSLESNPQCELLWLLYLKCYLFKKNSLNDYHEICLLCMDNLITYDLVWFILNTCPYEFVDLIFERYEKYLLSTNCLDLGKEFEQSIQVNQQENQRVSFYLFEMIIYNTYLKSISTNLEDTDKKEAKNVLSKYLNSAEIVSKLEPNDLSLLWLCLIHLEAFLFLPNWLCLSNLTNKISKSVESRIFWSLEKKRHFNRNLFYDVNYLYKNRLVKNSDSSLIQRQFDLFLLPWRQQAKYSCSTEKLQKLFHEALKSINTRCPANMTSSLSAKQEIRLFSLPLFINLINLEVSNKRFEIASKFCDRLLISADAKYLKELWINLIFIQKQQGSNQLEQTIQTSLSMFVKDAQILYIAAQYYASVNNVEKSIELIEEFILNFYFGKSRIYEVEVNTLFRHLLKLDITQKSLGTRESKRLKTDSILDKLDYLLNTIIDKFDLGLNLLYIAISYCYYLQLKGSQFYTFDFICETFERLIKNFNLVSAKTVLWIRYFKYISSCESQTPQEQSAYSDLVLKLIRKCFNDLNQISKLNQNALNPFNYLPNRFTLASRDRLSNNVFDIDSSSESPYYSFDFETNVELVSSSTFISNNTCSNSPNNNTTNFYYHNCIVDLLTRLFTRNQSEKFHLAKFLVDLMPSNSDLVKLFVSFSYKLNGLHKTLQMFYDHLSINSIDNEHLWVLCIKLCLDMNDLQQAVLIYHKAVMVCSRQKKSTIELKRISVYLFPSMNESDIL